MFKVFIEKREYHLSTKCEWITDYVSIDAVKPDELLEEEWDSIKQLVLELSEGKSTEAKDVERLNCKFDLYRIDKDEDWSILAESEHYYVLAENEEAAIFSKPDSRRIACVADHYGEPADAYIDPDERFCITVGCGIIKYNLVEPFEGYMYDRDTKQWKETGREGNIEWCDKIDEVTDSYIIVSCEGDDRRKFNLESLEKGRADSFLDCRTYPPSVV